jgi:crotonobetaine/carnitine-CoA ligase
MTVRVVDPRPSFASLWQRAVAVAPDNTFLAYEGADGELRNWTYREFDDLTARLGSRFDELGVCPGDSVHVALANCPTFVAVWLATALRGLVLIPSDPRSTSRELRTHIERTKPVVGVCSTANAAAYVAASDGMETIESAEAAEIDQALLGEPATGGASVSPTWSDRAAVLFTSGTTSAPKGVVVTQGNYAFTARVMAAAARLTPPDRFLVALPLFHANAQYYCIAPAIATASTVCLVPRFSARNYLAQAARLRATHVSLFAAPIRMILARGATPISGLSIRHAWYAQRLSIDEFEAIGTLLGCRPRELYGMTELMGGVVSGPATAAWSEAIGYPTLGCRIGTRAPDEHADDEEGGIGRELVVAGRRGIELCDGYLDDPETTAASWEGEWFKTGDLVETAEDGSLRFAGRRGETLKVAGENVSILEVEAVLNSHPAVQESAVVGEPDPVRDEVPVAFVVVQDGAATSAEALVDFCAERLSPAKRPRSVNLIAELPRTSVGKIRRHRLRPPGREPKGISESDAGRHSQ